MKTLIIAVLFFALNSVVCAEEKKSEATLGENQKPLDNIMKMNCPLKREKKPAVGAAAAAGKDKKAATMDVSGASK